MIHERVKNAVESGDISTLKYHFSGCLDGDPTFEEYKDDYEYCKEKGVLFEPYRELTPMSLSHVDDQYWVQLENDFEENPSIERLEHMRVVAKDYIYKDRVRRIEEERRAKQEREAEARKRAEERAAAERERQEQQAREAERQQAEAQMRQQQQAIGNGMHGGDDGIRRVSEPVRPQQPNNPGTSSHTGADGVRYASEPVRPQQPNNPGTSSYRDTNGAYHTTERQQGTSSKKANGMGCLVVLLLALIVILVIVVILV